MKFGRTLFSQVVDFVPWTSIQRIVSRYSGDIHVRGLRCSEQLRIMPFAKMKTRQSLRDMKACLDATIEALWHGVARTHCKVDFGRRK